MLTNSQVFSNLTLLITAVFVFIRYKKNQPIYNQILWGIFILTIATTALAELISWLIPSIPDQIPVIALAIERTIGAVCMVSATWCLIMHYRSHIILCASSIAVGIFLFVSVLWYHVEFMGLIILPFCIIISLCIACLGLAGRQKSALWVIFSMMLIALAAKSRDIPLPMDPIDINRYLMAISALCAGYAIRDENKRLF